MIDKFQSLFSMNFIRALIIVIYTHFLVSEGNAQQSGKVVFDGPQIKFATPTFDFGTVIGGKVIQHEFFFTNTGNKLLEIKDIKTSCGCATAGKWSREVLPGKSGSIPMEFFTVNLSGDIIKAIEVVCNVTNSPEISLQFKGKVWWPVELSPTAATLSFRPGAASNVTAVIRILNNDTNTLTLSELISSNPRIAAELSTVRPGTEYQLRIKLVPPLGTGNVFGQIKITTSSTKRPLLEIPVYAVVQPDVIALPSPLILPAKMTQNQLKQSVSIRSFWTNALSLTEASLNAKGISVELHELQPGRFFTFTFKFPEDFKISTHERIELRVKTNHPQFPVVVVPITQQAAITSNLNSEVPSRPAGTY